MQLLESALEWIFSETVNVKHDVVLVGDMQGVEVPERFDVVRKDFGCLSASECLEEFACSIEDEARYDGYEHLVAVVGLSCPYRPVGLLQRVLDEYARCGKPVITATRMCDTSSRKLDAQGRCKCNEEENKLFYDGRVLLYGIRQTQDALDCTKPHGVVEIDGFNVFCPDFAKTRESMYFDASGSRDCVLVGPCEDVIGREMILDIDTGLYGKVFRVNSFCEPFEDVGSRTDGIFAHDGDGVWNEKTRRLFGASLPHGELIDLERGYADYVISLPRCHVDTISDELLSVLMLVKRGFLPKLVGFGFKDGVDISVDDSVLDVWEKEKLLEM